MKRIRIISDPDRMTVARVENHDGTPIDGVRAVTIRMEAGCLPVATLEVIGPYIDVTTIHHTTRKVLPA